MSNLVRHAKSELERAGMLEEGSGSQKEWNHMVGNSVLELIRAFSGQRHSGATAMLTIELFTKLARFENLTPLTSDPAEWIQHSDTVWQNRRNGNIFSQDGGKTWYDINDPRTMLTSTMVEEK